mgnify:CR=1 FL=1
MEHLGGRNSLATLLQFQVHSSPKKNKLFFNQTLYTLTITVKNVTISLRKKHMQCYKGHCSNDH